MRSLADIMLRVALAVGLVLCANAAVAKEIYVSTVYGSDVDGTGESYHPYQTLTKAVSVAEKGDVVKVAGGVYEEAVVTAVEGLRVEGSYTVDFSARDLRNNRTVIKAPTASADCYNPTAFKDPVAEPLTDLAGNPRRWDKASRRVAGCFAFSKRGLQIIVR